MEAAELIADALTKAEACPADVRKAALLWIAPVQTVVAPAQAEATLKAGLALIHGFAQDPHLGFEQLSWFATAAVAPWRLTGLPRASQRGMTHSLADRVASVMSDHGHADYLRTYVLHDAPLADVPLEGIVYLLGRTTDDDERRRLLRRAIQVWAEREQSTSSLHPWTRQQFFPLFRASWTILPCEEALTVLEEIVVRILERPDTGTNSQIGEVLFTSLHALETFQMFDVLMTLDPERAQELVAAHPQLAHAINRYPLGLTSFEDEAEAERAKMPRRDPGQRGACIIGGNLDYGLAILKADDTGDFSKLLEHAWSSYRDDSNFDNPNEAPKAFWPSTSKFRTIFYKMAKVSGKTANRDLDSVPDAELRLFSQIECAAGLCGLPELESMTMGHRSGRRRRAWDLRRAIPLSAHY